jgi:hypothetical protein
VHEIVPSAAFVHASAPPWGDRADAGPTEAETNVDPAGGRFVTVTDVAGPGPRFRTVRV